MKIIVVNSNPVYADIEKKLAEERGAIVVHEKKELTLETLLEAKPDYIFVLHWSYIIQKEVFRNFVCVVFHMTDLPYGRGGSPLQNLIVRGHQETMLSAIQVEEGIDTGPVFLKKKLSLEGTAEEIFIRAGILMVQMIDEIITERKQPDPQVGSATIFKRRTPQQSNISSLTTLEEVYNYIRMLDAPGYPKAFIETEQFKIEFSRASRKADHLMADVKITMK